MSIPNTSAASAVQAFLAWLKAMGTAAGLTADQVVLAEEDRPRPALPYVTVRWVSDRSTGHPEQVSDVSGGAPRNYSVEPREALVSVQAYGREAEEWLERAIASRGQPASLALLSDIAIRPATGVRNLTVVLEGVAHERRAGIDVFLDYSRSTLLLSPETGTELQTLEVGGEVQRLPLSETDPDALPLDITAP